jgi:hypothetical protein
LLNRALKKLFDLKMIKEDEKKYIPTRELGDIKYWRGYIGDISRVRLSLMGRRLTDEDIVSDYRLMV